MTEMEYAIFESQNHEFSASKRIFAIFTTSFLGDGYICYILLSETLQKQNIALDICKVFDVWWRKFFDVRFQFSSASAQVLSVVLSSFRQTQFLKITEIEFGCNLNHQSPLC